MGNRSKRNYGHGDKVSTILKNLIEQHAKDGFPQMTIPEEKINQAFAIIDTHTRLLDNMTIINNYNMSVNVISTIVMHQVIQPDSQYDTKEKCKELIEDYISVFIDFSQVDDTNENLKELRANIKEYVVNSCMVYYAVYHKDKEFLKECNQKTEEALRNILKTIYSKAQINNIKTDDNNESIEIETETETTSTNKVIELYPKNVDSDNDADDDVEG